MSRSGREDDPTLTRSQFQRLSKYAHFIADLPACEFHVSRNVSEGDPDSGATYVPLDVGRAVLQDLHRCGLISKIDYLQHRGTTYHVWSVSEDIRERAQELISKEEETAIPGCRHSGIRNCGDGSYSCCHDDCDNVVPREEVRR